MKYVRNLILLGSLIGTLSLASTNEVSALENNDTKVSKVVQNGQPINFENVQDIDEVVRLIDDYYNYSNVGNTNDGISLFAAAGTKWGEGTVEYIGQGSNLVTNYFWVKGDSMVTWNIVGNAQRKAVIAKYGSVNNKTSYKMKTQQKVNMSPQTQGQVTVSAQAWCYAKD